MKQHREDHEDKQEIFRLWVDSQCRKHRWEVRDGVVCAWIHVDYDNRARWDVLEEAFIAGFETGQVAGVSKVG